MIVSKTPFRISFSGGSSDLPYYLEKRGYGCVISTSINKYMYINVNKNFYDTYILKYSKVENVKSIDDIEHPLIKNVLKRNYLRNIDFSSMSDIPQGSGLGTSSAFTVGLLNAVKTLKGIKETQYNLAKESAEIEIQDCKGNLGYQDQYGCAIGGTKFIEFSDTVKITKIPNYNLNYVLVHTNITHNTNENLQHKIDLNLIDDLVSLTKDLKDNKITLCECIKYNWEIKKNITKGFDDIYNLAINNGAICGKLLGSGNGGFFLFIVENADDFIAKMPFKCLKVCEENEGTKCISIN